MAALRESLTSNIVSSVDGKRYFDTARNGTRASLAK